MDISEVLAYKPAAPGQRKSRFTDNTDKDHAPSDSKRARLDTNEILKALDEASAAPTPGSQTDPAAIKKLLLQLDKKMNRNAELRVKFHDQPEKFMESELELHVALQELHVLATTPQFYPLLGEMNTVDALLRLLTHENTDISIAVIDLLEEMTDTDVLSENPDDTEDFLKRLIDNQVVALLVQNLERLDEAVKEENDGVHSSLGIIENISEARPDCLTDVASKHGVLGWILKRLSKKGFHPNKLYASEILAILVQNSEPNRALLGEQNGVDILLTQLAHYKRHDPGDSEEREMMENLFNCLCSALLLKSNKEKFLKGEGLQLMNLILREKRIARCAALKVLDYSMSGNDGSDNCIKFVEILGLRTLFPAFMRPPKMKKSGFSVNEMEEHICSVLCALFRNVGPTVLPRIINKFTENELEKVERLVELHFKYRERVRVADRKLEKEKLQTELWSGQTAEEIEDEVQLRRLELGLFTLQLVDIILLHVCTLGSESIARKVKQLLNLRGSSITTLQSVIQEYITSTNDEEERERIQTLLTSFEDKFLKSDDLSAGNRR